MSNRNLYKLVAGGPVSTYVCPDINKQVFWIFNIFQSKFIDWNNELGVHVRFWENIGLNKEK